MPQLMPLFWVLSVFMVLWLVFVMIDLFFEYSEYKFLSKNYTYSKLLSEYKW